MSEQQRPLRVVQWTTGKVASASLKAILERPNLELVGVYAFSQDKVGKDAGELVGLGRATGITATDDIDALIALQPDVVTYMPLHPDVDHMEKLLRAGINIATTASFMTGRGYGEGARQRLEAAARAGQASLFGSGINPGWIDSVVAAASSLCQEVNLIRVTESFNIGLWAGDANQDALGWGRPAGDPGHAADIEQATLPFGDAVEAVAHMFGFKLDDIRCEVEFAHATEDLDIPGRDVKKDTVAGIYAKWLGLSAGLRVVELCVQWSISPDIEPEWDVAMAHLVEISGTPQVKLRAEMLPDDPDMPMEEMVNIGFVITAMPVVNALPAVVNARPGIVTYADLPLVTSVLKPSAKVSASVPSGPALVAADNGPADTAGHRGDASPLTPESLAGHWTMRIKAPTGAMEVGLDIEYRDGLLSGSQSAQGQTSPVSDIQIEGNQVSWINIATKPIRMKCRFMAEVTGNRMSGKMKAGIMGKFAFTAEKS